MRKVILYAWIYLLITIVNVDGQGILDLKSDLDVDHLTPIECTIRPIVRKSCTHVTHGAHLELNDSLSLNWSGYAAFTGYLDIQNPTYGSVTDVSGTWIVPSVVANPNGDTFSSTWVGIDGYNNSTVEQIGTEQDVINGSQNNYAWFDLYPAATQIIEGFPVDVGDVIEGRVRYLGQEDGNDVFRLTIKNLTQRKKFTIVQQTQTGIPAHRSSAEWIVEAPGIISSSGQLAILPLANFSSIAFNKCKTEIDGRVGSINNKHWTFDAIAMTSRTTRLIKATPSSLDSKGKSFVVTWDSSGQFPYELVQP